MLKNKEATFCICCHRTLRPVEEFWFADDCYCQDCLDTQTVCCDYCGQRIYLDDAISDDYVSVCPSCYDMHYTRCENCDCLLHSGDAYYMEGDDYCYDCYKALFEDTIHSYSYKPTPHFYGIGKLFLGVELEIDEGGKIVENARTLLDIANRNKPHLYIKTDGSLEDGMELVSHPMSLRYHRRDMPWEEILDEAISLGYSSHKAKTCGLHVHVNRSYFGESLLKQELAISRVLYIVERYWYELLRFSRRTKSQISKWAVRYGYENTPTDILDKAKCSSGRYTCVNLTNEETIEFRIFRGTLRYNTFIATLELVSLICKYALHYTDSDLQEFSWTRFVLSIEKEEYPELVTYLKERQLYVNEPVIDKGEY